MRKSQLIKVKGFTVGGNSPVRVESMLKSSINDVEANIKEAITLSDAGCELVRLSIPSRKSIELYENLRKEVSIPIMGDFHFSFQLIKESIERGMRMVRINPGNLKKSKLKELISMVKMNDVLVRIGVNSASFRPPLPPGEETAHKMVEVLKKWISPFEESSHPLIICSLKSSDVRTTVLANQLFSESYDYPLHIGITEAGGGEEGIIRSSVGIGILLWKGIGDTIRISLTGPSVSEVNTAYNILNILGIREKKEPEFISCPMCGRSRINVREILGEVKKAIREKHRKLPGIKIAVMGCEVNGPGEASMADIGIAGGKTYSLIFRKGKIVRKVKRDKMIEVFMEELDKIS